MGADWRSRDSDVLRGWSQHEHQWATAIGRWRPLSRGTFHKVWRQRYSAARSPTDTDQKLLGQVRFFFCWHLILEQWLSQDCSSWYTVIFMHQPTTCSGGIIFSGRPSGCPSVNTPYFLWREISLGLLSGRVLTRLASCHSEWGHCCKCLQGQRSNVKVIFIIICEY